MQKLTSFVDTFFKYAAWGDDETWEEYNKRLTEEAIDEDPVLRGKPERHPSRPWADLERDLRYSRKRGDKINEEVIREEAEETGRDPDVEVEAYRNRTYMVPHPLRDEKVKALWVSMDQLPGISLA
jgi:hypothetical protein